jgi:Carboxypeptidase regulatory-like domain
MRTQFSGTSRPLVLAAALFAIGAGTAYAQVQAGRIVGTVYDPQKAAVPGAAITVTDTATNVTRRVAANDAGGFVVTPLNPGSYSISATSPGFQTTVRGGIELVVGDAVRVDLELRLGETSTQVQVVAEAAALNTESGTLGQAITNTQIVNLPLNGRGFYELARLTPGATLLPSTGNVQKVRPEAVNGTVISGVRGGQTTFLLDGADTTEQHQGGTWIQTSIDALQELSVQQNAYSAEYARAGGFFNATTKSGTNSFHGVLFEFLRNDQLDARNFFLPKREVLKRNQFGGTIGGPVILPGVFNGRNTTFFFLSYEATRERQGLVFNSLVPSAAQRAGNFGAVTNRIYDPLTTAPNPSGSGNIRVPFANNVIPQNRLSPQAQFFTRYISLPNTAAGTAAFGPARAYDADQVTFRGDRELSTSHKAFLRFSWHDNRQIEPAQYPELGAADLRGPARNLALALTSNVRPNMIHEARFSYLFGQYRSEAYFEGQGAAFNRQIGLIGLETNQDPSTSSLPAFTWSGYTGYSGNGADGRPKWQDRWAWEVTDSLTWIKGAHILKFGTRIHYFKPLFTDIRTQNGRFNFTGIATENPASTTGTGESFADFMLGYPADAGRGNPATWWGGYGTYWHFFAQDDFKVHNRLTLNLGLRYEYTPWLNAYRGQVATFDPTRAKSIIVGTADGQIDLGAQRLADVGYNLFRDIIQTASEAGLQERIAEPDKRQWAPRFGFAWRPFGETTVVRGGYGIFYESEGTSHRLNFNFLPWSLTENVNADRGVTPTRTLHDFFLGVPFGTSVLAPSWAPSPVRIRQGYDQHWNFGVQRELPGRTVLEVNYVGNKGAFLNGSTHINHPAAGAGSIQARRPYPRFGTMDYRDQNVSSNYHSLQAKAERRFNAGFWYLASYTFSKSLWHEATPAVGGNGGWEKALSAFDAPHNFIGSFGYELPFGKGKALGSNLGRIANGIVGGWQLQGIIGFRSGLPFTPTVSRDVANNGVNAQRPNRIASGKLEKPTLASYFDKTAFVVPANFTFGNSGGRILRSDKLGVTDFSLFKQFAVTESANVQLRAEVFNMPNTAYFSAPANTNIDAAAGARVTTTSNGPRQVQFGLKFSF